MSHTGYVCKRCGGQSPRGIGYAVTTEPDGTAADVETCECGYSVKPGTYDYETHERGVNHGWDAANYADAYGITQTAEEEAEARAAQYADADPTFHTSAYTTGFAEGWERFTEGQWQDGSPREQD